MGVGCGVWWKHMLADPVFGRQTQDYRSRLGYIAIRLIKQNQESFCKLLGHFKMITVPEKTTRQPGQLLCLQTRNLV